MKQNLTVSLDAELIRKAKILAARRSTSISALLTEQVEALVGRDDAYTRAKERAAEFLRTGFHLGFERVVDRAELHER